MVPLEQVIAVGAAACCPTVDGFLKHGMPFVKYKDRDELREMFRSMSEFDRGFSRVYFAARFDDRKLWNIAVYENYFTMAIARYCSDAGEEYGDLYDSNRAFEMYTQMFNAIEVPDPEEIEEIERNIA